ncbi:MAG: hypothetical protein SGILL_008619 [Bacillariaceae sp.]
MNQLETGHLNIVDDSSVNGSSKEGDFEEEDEGDGNLNEREIQEIYSMLNQAELGNQGFVASVASTSDGNTESNPQSKWEDVDCIDFNGRTFHVGQCYSYLKPGATFCTPIWIWKFASENTAYYAEVRPSTQTFLGTPFEPSPETKLVNKPLFEKERALGLPMDNVKIIQKKPLLLRDIQEEITSPLSSMPEWTYIRRRKNNSLRFGYIYQPNQAPPTRAGVQKSIMRVLVLFSGAGLMDQGFKNVPGFKTVGAVEIDKVSVKTFKENNPGVPAFNQDVRKFLKKCKTDPKFRDKIGLADVLHASPPCQGFSGANIWGGQNDEANNDLSLIWLDFIEFFRPLVATFENVAGMWRGKHLHYLTFILKELLRMGYQFRVDVLRACDYGDPQIRPRLIIIASQRHVLLPQFPQPTHGNKESGLLPYVTVSEVIEGIGVDEQDEFDGLRQTSLGKDDKNVIVLEENKLAPTMRAKGPPVLHYKEDRCIGVREFAALQSCPLNYNFFGKPSEKYRQIGNGVPVRLATAIAKAVWESLRFKYVDTVRNGKASQVRK